MLPGFRKILPKTPAKTSPCIGKRAEAMQGSNKASNAMYADPEFH
jgi:hypothetical protein